MFNRFELVAERFDSSALSFYQRDRWVSGIVEEDDEVATLLATVNDLTGERVVRDQIVYIEDQSLAGETAQIDSTAPYTLPRIFTNRPESSESDP